ncbi:MAG: iron-containing alcohol dehydrogenase [Oscillospiraceae bacterium]
MSYNYDATLLYRMPTKVYYGISSTNIIPQEVRNQGATKVMLVSDKGIVGAGLVDPILKSLKEANIPCVVFDDIEVDPGNKICEVGAKFLKDNGCDIIVIVGGGSPICAAKGMAILATNGGDIRDYKGVEKFKIPPIPTICVPTTAGSGSEVSAATVLHDEDDGRSTFTMNGFHLFPKAAILDPLVLRRYPTMPFLFAALDALTHAVESLYTTEATPITDALALDAIRLMIENLPSAAYSDDLEAKGMQLVANVMANMACGNAKLGLVHGMAASANMYGINHGMGLGILLPHVMEYNLPVAQEKFARLADMCGWSKDGMNRQEKATAVVEGMRAFLTLLRVPDRFPADKVPHDAIPSMAERAMKMPQSSVFNKRKPNINDMIAIYEKAFKGWY